MKANKCSVYESWSGLSLLLVQLEMNPTLASRPGALIGSSRRQVLAPVRIIRHSSTVCPLSLSTHPRHATTPTANRLLKQRAKNDQVNILVRCVSTNACLIQILHHQKLQSTTTHKVSFNVLKPKIFVQTFMCCKITLHCFKVNTVYRS